MRRNTVTLESQPEMVVRLCGHLGLAVTARFQASGDDELFPNRLTVEGPDAQWFLANRGMGLDALQFLVHEAHGERDEGQVAHLDIHNARLFRLQELKVMTQMAITRTREMGSYTFGPLNSRERRWIHLLVAREADVVSESEGTGTLKTLKVFRKPGA
jgi:predicted RNA-binding protein Jag